MAAPSIPGPPPADPRLRILAAAGNEFATGGYEAATVRDICAAAAVNVAAVNYYFGDKRRLYLETVRHAHQELVRKVPRPEWAPGTPPVVKLRDFLDTMLERMLGLGHTSWQTRLMLREVLHPTEACRELVEDYIRPHFTLLVSILDELSDHRLRQPELRRIAMGIVGQCFIYRAAADVVGMLVPAGERESLHAPAVLAAHITQATLAVIAGHMSPASLRTTGLGVRP